MARTRSKPAAKAKEPSPEPTASTIKPLPKSTTNPPKLFVLPKDASKDARIVTLDNPSNGTPSRYYFCPQKGFYEFTRIAAPKKDCKSWLITGNAESEDADTEEKEEVRIGSGYTTSAADLFIATPIDTLFLIVPALAPKSAKDTKQHYLALDDYLDMLSSSSRHWKALLAQHPSLKIMIEKRMRAVCDTVDAGDESMYRISHEKLAATLLQKAERMVAHGLPPSLEEKYVKTALEVPVMSIRREDSTLSAISTTETTTTTEDASTPSTSFNTTIESQTSVETITADPSDDSIPTLSTSTAQITIATTISQSNAPPPTLTTPEEIPHLLRLRTSLTYLSSTYLPTSLRTTITTHLSSQFAPLDTHLAAIAKLKSEAAALRSISDNISRKRAIEDDDEKVAEREEKKRKKEEEERKKKAEGRGIKQLKKVDTSGMKKMSSFFTKMPKKA